METKRRRRRIGCLAALIFAACMAAVFPFPHDDLVKIPVKMALGEGGVLHRLGTVRASSGDATFEYDAYFGRGKYASGRDMAELLLLARQMPLSGREWLSFRKMLLGRDDLFFTAGLRYVKLPFGFLPMTCLGGVSLDKGLFTHTLDISYAFGTNRFSLAFSDYRDGVEFKHEITFDVPDEIINALPRTGAQ